MVIKQCGVLRNGVPCKVLIDEKRSACTVCCATLLTELERMADGPLQHWEKMPVAQKWAN